MTTIIVLIIIGFVLYLVLRGRQDQPEQLGASRRALPTGPLEPHTFACPYPKCPTCGASGDKMKQEWDGLRSVKWSCSPSRTKSYPPRPAGSWDWTPRPRAPCPCNRAATGRAAAWAGC